MVKVSPLKDTKVFAPIKVGENELAHKIVFPPTTRFRATSEGIPSDLQLQYYEERSRYPGSLLVTEGTFPTEKTGGYFGVPGIYNDEQVQAWKQINDKVHANKSFTSIQFWALGRVSDPKFCEATKLPLIAPSEVYLTDEEKAFPFEEVKIHTPSTEELEQLIRDDYTKAAKNAVAAGFDYIELHSAHASKLAIRFSPWATFQGMKGAKEEIHPYATFSYVVGELQKRANNGKELAYISLVEPRVSGIMDVKKEDQAGDNEFIKKIWKGVLLRAGNYSYDAPEFNQLLSDVDDERTLVGFSRYYISNPDLVFKLHEGHDLTPYDRETFYLNSNWGYNTYTVYGKELQIAEEEARKHLPEALKSLKV
ncbi:NADH:flavin oxidoreductase/NADH oxidase [Hyphopichia burtonii NRRL Y-1933]|uniref:NADH:flavin oxidoreductase/NADH oxidase n=1 Tax=Hyphopichia burtonii NRRL Y-1933 TaxID=984485 RepID=A0A1E4RCN4_9ASCO|nr:NADH:flavin oxidoreductase/NADH oxidase [Hyphopichia burtonii NRRL Y-1933]ODV64895.1 NADH:flavin oxidoreductase/NADH oxidase [Hyphopichia burtonii NRRL Y-1933]